MRFKAAWAGALLAGAVMAAPAQAQITFSGTTSGCFGASCVAGPGPTATTGAGLVFNFGSFLATTNPSGQANVGGVGNNFGTFTVTSAPYNYDGTPFSLFFNFTAPGGSVSDPMFAAVVNGEILNTTDGVNVVFTSPLTRQVTLSDGTVAFVTLPNLVAVNANNPAQQVSGYITATPEPASMTLLATGLVGIFGAARRRRKNVA